MTRTLVSVFLTLAATMASGWLGPRLLSDGGLTVRPYDTLLLACAGLLLGFVLSILVAPALAHSIDAALARLESARRGRTLTILAVSGGVLLLTPVLDDLSASMIASPEVRSLGTLGVLTAIGALLGTIVIQRLPSKRGPEPLPRRDDARGGYLLDTSAIIDGRFLEAMEANLSQGPLYVPSFVLRELQGIAGDRDAHRRRRGRRGLGNLERVKANPTLNLAVLESDDTPGESVDDQLLHLAHALGASLVTTDYNLDQVAEVRGISVVNANRVAAAMRLAHHPGDQLDVYLQRKGKEPGQGVGFLDDGTMVVVEEGERLLGNTVTIEITSSLQTNAGRMLFAKPGSAEKLPGDTASNPA